MTTTKQRIRLSDGRTGWQYVDGDGVLQSVVITRLASGDRVEHVYARQSSLRDGIFSLTDLGNVSLTLEAAK